MPSSARVSGFIAEHVAVGGNPLQDQCIVLVDGGKSGGKVVMASVAV